MSKGLSTITPWKTLSTESVFSGGPIREIVRESVALPDGRVIADYYKISLPDYVLIYAVTVEGDVLVFNQYRHGVGRACLGFPGGQVDPGESPADAARRELLEETGFQPLGLTHLTSLAVSANQGCGTAHLFVARECRPVGQPVLPDMEAPELIRMRSDQLTAKATLSQMAGASHVALAFLAKEEIANGLSTEER